MRHVAPISPALHWDPICGGRDRHGEILQRLPERTRGDLYPTLAQLAGHVINSIFLDSLAVDIERLGASTAR